MKRFYYLSHKSKVDDACILHVRDCWVLPAKSKYAGRYKSLQEAIGAVKSQCADVSICEYCLDNPDKSLNG